MVVVKREGRRERGREGWVVVCVGGDEEEEGEWSGPFFSCHRDIYLHWLIFSVSPSSVHATLVDMSQSFFLQKKKSRESRQKAPASNPKCFLCPQFPCSGRLRRSEMRARRDLFCVPVTPKEE